MKKLTSKAALLLLVVVTGGCGASGPPDAEVYRRHGDGLLRDWRPDGPRLAALAGEAELFEQVAQRKALQAELDEVRHLRSRLRGIVGEWQKVGVRGQGSGIRGQESEREQNPRKSITGFFPCF